MFFLPCTRQAESRLDRLANMKNKTIVDYLQSSPDTLKTDNSDVLCLQCPDIALAMP